MAKKKRNNLLIWILVIAVVALVAIAAIFNRQKPQGTKVTAEEAKLRTITEIVAASGKIFPQTEVKISSDVSGEIVELLVEEGDSVKAGQLLAKIDPEAIQSQVERGKAQLNSARAQLANSRANVENARAQKQQIIANLENAREIHKRNEQLFNEGVISEQEFDASLSNMRALEANLAAAEASIESSQQNVKAAEYSVQSSKASLEEIQTSLNRTSIFAPMSGTVSQLSVEQGERVVGTIQMTGTEMMRIANLNAMEVRVEVSENDIPRVAVGNEVDIEVDAYLDRKFKGYVTQIANSATNTGTAISLTSDQVTNFEVRISIDQSSYQDLIDSDNPFPFRPGMSASVEIKTKTVRDVVAIPIQAVTTREPDQKKSGARAETVSNASSYDDDLIEVVFLIKADTAAMSKVVTGIQDDTYIQIKSGIEEGQMVISGPYSAVSKKLKSGQAIQKVKEEELFSGS